LFNVINRCVRHKSHGPILVVEDDAAIRESIQSTLQAEGLDVDTVFSAESAFSHIGDYPPALLILNMEMPTMNAFEFLNQLRHNPRWRNIPVIVRTGRVLTETEVKRLQAQSAKVMNMAEYDSSELLQEVHGLLDLRLSSEQTRLTHAASSE
jgi:DNA-binding response OmpR family regulator